LPPGHRSPTTANTAIFLVAFAVAVHMKPVASLDGRTLHVVSTREPGVLELQAGA